MKYFINKKMIELVDMFSFIYVFVEINLTIIFMLFVNVKLNQIIIVNEKSYFSKINDSLPLERFQICVITSSQLTFLMHIT